MIQYVAIIISGLVSFWFPRFMPFVFVSAAELVRVLSYDFFFDLE